MKEHIGVPANLSTILDRSIVVVDHSFGRDFSVRDMLSMVLSALMGWRYIVMFVPGRSRVIAMMLLVSLNDHLSVRRVPLLVIRRGGHSRGCGRRRLARLVPHLLAIRPFACVTVLLGIVALLDNLCERRVVLVGQIVQFLYGRSSRISGGVDA